MVTPWLRHLRPQQTTPPFVACVLTRHLWFDLVSQFGAGATLYTPLKSAHGYSGWSPVSTAQWTVQTGAKDLPITKDGESALLVNYEVVLSYISFCTINATAVFADLLPQEELKKEGQRTGTFDILDRPPDDVHHNKSGKFISTNAITAVINAPETSAPFNDENINIESWNIETTKIWVHVEYFTCRRHWFRWGTKCYGILLPLIGIPRRNLHKNLIK